MFQPAINFLDNFAGFERTDGSLAPIQMSFEFINRIFAFPNVDDNPLLSLWEEYNGGKA